jgi:hypothetical protein
MKDDHVTAALSLSSVISLQCKLIARTLLLLTKFVFLHFFVKYPEILPKKYFRNYFQVQQYTTEELLEWKSQENQDYGREDPLRRPRDTLCSQK